MTSVVTNECFGGFSLSEAAKKRMRDLGWDGKYDFDLERDDPRLVRTVRELGSKEASGAFASLAIVEVPDDADWYIHEYDGSETIYEKHRAWDSAGEQVMAK